MKILDLVNALIPKLEERLATKLVVQFLEIRRDLASSTLERAVCGKFVETFVQCLQYLENGVFEERPEVDKFLLSAENKATLDEGLRLCGTRIARSIYTLRNKRNIAHNSTVSPNTVDLHFIYVSSSWLLAELLRTSSNLSMEEAGKYIALLKAPVGTLVEDFGSSKLVLADVSIAEEILILLHSAYPDPTSISTILDSLNRRSGGSVKNSLSNLVKLKYLQKIDKKCLVLTQRGFKEAIKVIVQNLESTA